MTNKKQDFSKINIDELLAARRQVPVIWSTEDVQSIRDDLSDDQAWAVLQQCQRVRTCKEGFTWTLIEGVVARLFPECD